MQLLSLHLPWTSHPIRRDVYELLPSSSSITKPRKSYCGRLTLRRLLQFLAAVPALLVLAILASGIPPSFDHIRESTRALPQHNLPLSLAGRRRYLRFAKPLTGRGFNNVLQESLLMSYIALEANRSYVFHDHVWSELPLRYTIYDFALRPTRMPFRAYISGPGAGGEIKGYPEALRAISEEFWREVCPPERVRGFSSKDAPTEWEGEDIVNWWKDELAKVDDECVEVSPDKDVFSQYLFGDKHILSLWPSFSKSPILTQFTWSHLVDSAILRNTPLVHGLESTHDKKTTENGLVAIHLRRGDYKRHCVNLSRWGASWLGFNSFPSFLDTFSPPSSSEEEKLNYYILHCLPTTTQIVTRLGEIRSANPGLRRVHILSNGWGWWLDGLITDLKKDGWEASATHQLSLDKEQWWVSGAVDMGVAVGADVFVGNGFSSLSSNIVMLRMARGVRPETNRFL